MPEVAFYYAFWHQVKLQAPIKTGERSKKVLKCCLKIFFNHSFSAIFPLNQILHWYEINRENIHKQILVSSSAGNNKIFKANMKNMFILNPVLENLNPIFTGNKIFYTLWLCAGIFFRHWLRRLCNISLKAGEEIKFKMPSHRYIHSLGLTMSDFWVFTAALPHPRHLQTLTAPGGPPRTTYWSGSSSGSGRVTSPVKNTSRLVMMHIVISI